jgi:hypothetical protein
MSRRCRGERSDLAILGPGLVEPASPLILFSDYPILGYYEQTSGFDRMELTE